MIELYVIVIVVWFSHVMFTNGMNHCVQYGTFWYKYLHSHTYRVPCIESILNEPLEPPLLCPSWKLWRVLSKNQTCMLNIMNLPDLVHEEHQRAPFLWQDSVRNSSLCNLRVSSGYEFAHLLDSTQCSPSVTSHVADAILWYILKASIPKILTKLGDGGFPSRFFDVLFLSFS